MWPGSLESIKGSYSDLLIDLHRQMRWRTDLVVAGPGLQPHTGIPLLWPPLFKIGSWHLEMWILLFNMLLLLRGKPTTEMSWAAVIVRTELDDCLNVCYMWNEMFEWNAIKSLLSLTHCIVALFIMVALGLMWKGGLLVYSWWVLNAQWLECANILHTYRGYIMLSIHIQQIECLNMQFWKVIKSKSVDRTFADVSMLQKQKRCFEFDIFKNNIKPTQKGMHEPSKMII